MVGALTTLTSGFAVTEASTTPTSSFTAFPQIHFWDSDVEGFDAFLPRMYRVNHELFAKVTGFPLMDYAAETYLRWYTREDILAIPKYFPYVEYCETVRGRAATECRDERSEAYIAPFDYAHFEQWQNFGRGR